MKTGTIKYSAEFRSPEGLSRWAGIELQYEQGHEDPAEVYKKAVEIISKSTGQAFLDNSNLDPYSPTSYWAQPLTTSIIQINPEDREIGLRVEDILSCKDLVTLNSYRFLAKNSLDLMNAFNIKHAELTQK